MIQVLASFQDLTISVQVKGSNLLLSAFNGSVIFLISLFYVIDGAFLDEAFGSSENFSGLLNSIIYYAKLTLNHCLDFLESETQNSVSSPNLDF